MTKRIKTLSLILVLMFVFVLSSLPVSAAQKKELLDENGKPFALLELGEGWVLKESDEDLMDAEKSYIVFDTIKQEEIADINICADKESVIFYADADDEDMYSYKEGKTRYNLSYCRVMDKETKEDYYYILMDKDKHIVFITLMASSPELGDTMINSVVPIHGDRFEALKNPVIDEIHKAQTRDVAVSTVISMVIGWLLAIIGKYKMFPKMGLQKFKSFIPVYSDYLIFKKTWNKKMFFVYCILYLCVFIPQFIYDAGMSIGYSLHSNLFAFKFISGIILLFVLWIHASWVSQSFGKGEKYAFLVMFLAPIAYIILGWSKAEYIGNAYELHNSNDQKGQNEPSE